MNTYPRDYNRRLAPLGFCASVACIAALFSSNALATPTGLNNIVTADTPPVDALVFQAFANVGDERLDDYFIGFKTGIELFEQKFEWGVDGRLGAAADEFAVFQVKYAAQPWENLPMIAVGAANIALSSDDRREAGQAAKYVVATHDFGGFRAHGGFSFQHKNDAAFVGLDKTIQFLERDLMLRTDFIQIDDGRQWLGSAGFIYFLDEHIAVESWISQPFEHGEATFTLKLNLIFEFR